MNKKGRESGQALLIVIFAITLGLVALVAVSTRIVNSTKRVFIDNAYYKAQAAAEAGAERFLLKSNSDLKAIVDDNKCKPGDLYTADGFVDDASIPASCKLDTADGFTEARAVMAVETYPSGNEYDVSSLANSTVSINLIGATPGKDVVVCWQAEGLSGPKYSEVLSFYYFKNSGVYKLEQQKNVCSDFVSWCNNKPASYHTSDALPASGVSGQNLEYACFTIHIDSADTPQLLNLVSLVNGSLYQITFKDMATAPAQGYRITSVGEVKSGATGGSLANSTATRKKVVVEKSNMPNLGAWFNFAAASESDKIVAEP